jgi:integrase
LLKRLVGAWPMLLTKTVRPAAVRTGIEKRIGWHTCRHTYSTMLVANGENVKVIQKLMRHASSRSTLEIYSQAPSADERQAKRGRIVAFPRESKGSSLVSDLPSDRF